MSETWSTTIGEVKPDGYCLRGQPITELMASGDWLGTLLLALLGRAPKPYERSLAAACLIGAIDHGTAPPSARVTRVVASCGKPVADSVAAGLLTLGPRHGNAAAAAGEWLKAQIAQGIVPEQAVQTALSAGIRLSGFGHAEYERDPRAVTLAKLGQEVLPEAKHLVYALAVGDELTKQKGKPLYLNIDGAMGAIMADLEWPTELADVLFILARSVGLCAHALEEAPLSKSYRR